MIGAAGCIENTAPAFRGRHRQGLRHRVRPAAGRDGTPMVFHDATLDRLVAARGPISPSTRRRTQPNCATRTRTNDPDLCELLTGRRARALLVEIKSESARMPNAFLDAIARQAAQLSRADRADVIRSCGRRGARQAGAADSTRRWSSAAISSPRIGGRGRARAGQNAAASPPCSKKRRRSQFSCRRCEHARGRQGLAGAACPGPCCSPGPCARANERAAAARWADAPIFEVAERAGAVAMS